MYFEKEDFYGYLPFVFVQCHYFLIHDLSPFFFYMSSTTSVAKGAGTACPLGAHEYIPRSGVRVELQFSVQRFVTNVLSFRFFFFLSLYCLFFDLWLQIISQWLSSTFHKFKSSHPFFILEIIHMGMGILKFFHLFLDLDFGCETKLAN